LAGRIGLCSVSPYSDTATTVVQSTGARRVIW